MTRGCESRYTSQFNVTMDIQFTNIPARLKEHQQWICWDTGVRDGKETKLPKDPGGGFAQTDDPSTWAPFPKAHAKQSDHDGIGFVFTEDDDLVGIDLDKCRDADTGEWEDWALDVLSEMGGFIEISPSGTGAHIILEGEIPGDRRRKGNIEIYEDGRYFTVTGNVVSSSGEPLSDSDEATLNSNQEGLNEIYEEYLVDEEDEGDEDDDTDSGNIKITPPGGDRPDLANLGYDRDVDIPFSPDPTPEVLNGYEQDLLKEAKKADNGYGFTLLWRGDWEEFYRFSEKHNETGYSQSEADLAFCNKLSFWCSGDPILIDRIFRASGLMRPKWNEKHYSDGTTYGERTVEKAIARVEAKYDDDRYDEVQARSDDGAEDSPDETKKKETEDDTELEPSNSDGEGSRSRDGDRGGPSAFESSSQKKTDEQPGPEPSKRSSENDRRHNPDPRTRGSRRSREERNSSISDFSPASTESNTGHFTANPTKEEPQTAGEGSENEQNNNQENPTTEDAETTPPGENGEVSLDTADSFDRPSESEGSMFDDEVESEDTEPADDLADEETTSETDLDPEEGLAAVKQMQAEHDAESESGSDTNSRSDGDADTTDSESEDDDGFGGSGGETDDSTEQSGEEQAGDNTDGSEEDREDEEGEEKIDGSPSTNGKQIIPSALERRVSDLEQEVGRIDERLTDQKGKLNNELDMQEEKISRVYRELEHYENLVDKREHQMETLQQILFVMCKARNHPIFDEIAEGLADKEIPMEDILDESFIERIQARESTVGEQQPPYPEAEHDTEPTHDSNPTELQPAPAEPQPPAQQNDEPDEDRDSGRSFLSSFF